MDGRCTGPGSMDEEEWRKRLSPGSFRVLRLGGTEPPFHNEYWDEKRAGVYECAGCRLPLFRSEDKYDSGTGWPSFSSPITPESVEEREEMRFGHVRTEAICSRCGGHLGHVFDDGPPPSGRRFCMNSASLRLIPVHDEERQTPD